MKNFFKRMKSYSFWVSFSGALIIFVNSLGRIFGFEIESQIVEDCVMSIAGVLVVLGFVTMKDKANNEDFDDEKLYDDNDILEDDENHKYDE